MSQPVNCQTAEILIGEVEPEIAPEIFESFFYLAPAERRDGTCKPFKCSFRVHLSSVPNQSLSLLFLSDLIACGFLSKKQIQKKRLLSETKPDNFFVIFPKV
jgi:hypothetical protein